MAYIQCCTGGSLKQFIQKKLFFLTFLIIKHLFTYIYELSGTVEHTGFFSEGSDPLPSPVVIGLSGTDNGDDNVKEHTVVEVSFDFHCKVVTFGCFEKCLIVFFSHDCYLYLPKKSKLY